MNDRPMLVDLADDDDRPERYYQLVLPDGERVGARIAGEGDPVYLLVPGIAMRISRDAAWALWAVLADVLPLEPDAVPGWVPQDPIEPTDMHGNPLPGWRAPDLCQPAPSADTPGAMTSKETH